MSVKLKAESEEQLERSGGPNPRLSPDELALRQQVAQQMKAQCSVVHANVQKGEKVKAVDVDSKVWTKKMADAVRPVWYKIFKAGGDDALKNVRKFKKGITRYSRKDMMDSVPVQIVIKYDPDQPRDDGGKWTSGGTFYHGTEQGKLDRILGQGLIPHGSGGMSASKVTREFSKRVVYMSRKKDNAIEYAETLTNKRSDKYPVVLEIKIPKGNTLFGDKFSFSNADFYKVGEVPKDWIVAYHTPTFRGKYERTRVKSEVDEDILYVVAMVDKGGMVRSSSTDLQDAEDSVGSTPTPPSQKKARSGSIVIPDWIEDPEVLTAIENELFKFAHSINQTTADALREELLEGMENGETIDQLSDRITSLSDDWVEGGRSEMIARTESARAMSTGHIEAWKATGVVDRKVWVAAGDACPFCLDMDGTVVDLDDTFFDQGETQDVEWRDNKISMSHDYSDIKAPPLHPNCRCAVIGELKEEYQPEDEEKGLVNKDWDESPHPRGPDGKFGESGASVGTPTPEEYHAARLDRINKESAKLQKKLLNADPEKAGSVVESHLWGMHARINVLERKVNEVRDARQATYDKRIELAEKMDEMRKTLEVPGMSLDERNATLTNSKEYSDLKRQFNEQRDLAEVLLDKEADLNTEKHQVTKDVDAVALNSMILPEEYREGMGTLSHGETLLNSHMSIAHKWVDDTMLTSTNTVGVARLKNLPDNEWRAYHSSMTGTIFTSAKSSGGTFVHEYGHHIETELADVHERALAILDKHSGKGSAVPLTNYDSRYGAKEITIPDKWKNPYTGKQYPGGPNRFTEVTSMALGQFYESPTKLMKEEPELFRHAIYTIKRARGV